MYKMRELVDVNLQHKVALSYNVCPTWKHIFTVSRHV